MSINYKQIRIGWKTRLWIRIFHLLLKPWLGWVVGGSHYRIAKQQVSLARRPIRRTAGLPCEQRIINRVPGPVIGDLTRTDGTAILWLHGGAFVIPAAVDVHVPMLARLCREFDAVGFLPDYRLAPFNPFPAGLDDCERAYKGLLDLGFKPDRIVVCGDSAGGNLTLGTLQRIRKHGWPMPACAVLLSPVTELARAHFPPSRPRNLKRDAMIPVKAMYTLDTLYADYRGFPPLYFLVGETEVLLDDSVMAAQQALAAGVDARVDVWSHLPHVFPLFESLLPEARPARQDIVDFIRLHLPTQMAADPPAVRELRAVK